MSKNHADDGQNSERSHKNYWKFSQIYPDLQITLSFKGRRPKVEIIKDFCNKGSDPPRADIVFPTILINL